MPRVKGSVNLTPFERETSRLLKELDKRLTKMAKDTEKRFLRLEKNPIKKAKKT